MVTSLERSCSLCDSTEHVSFLQGEMLFPHRLASTTVYSSHILSLQKKERSVSEVLSHDLMKLIYDYLGRQTTTDMFEMHLKTPRRSVNLLNIQSVNLFIYQTLFHYDGVYGLSIYNRLF